MKRSDEAGYRDYVTARMEVLRRTAYLLCRNWHTADDLVSVTIGKLYRHWKRVADMPRLDGYVHKILLNVWLDERRRPWRREQATEVLSDAPAAPEPDVVGRAELLDLLATLPPKRRAAT